MHHNDHHSQTGVLIKHQSFDRQRHIQRVWRGSRTSREFRRGDHIQRVSGGCTVTRSDRPYTRAYGAYDAGHGSRLADKGGGAAKSTVVVAGEARCDAARRATCVRRASARFFPTALAARARRAQRFARTAVSALWGYLEAGRVERGGAELRSTSRRGVTRRVLRGRLNISIGYSACICL